MSLKGLEILRDLTEITNTGQALDNLCQGEASPFNSDDFKVFRSNKINTSTLTFIPSSFTYKLTAYTGIDNIISVKQSTDIQEELVNVNISAGDAISAIGLGTGTLIDRIDVFSSGLAEDLNKDDLPVTELVLSRNLSVSAEDLEITISKQNYATIKDDFFVLGRDIRYSFYNNDVITSILYPLSTTATPLLSTDILPLYVVDLFIDRLERINFGLSLTKSGSRVSLTSLNPLSVINLYRNNEVTQQHILNILQPVSREPKDIIIPINEKVIDDEYSNTTVSFDDNFNTIQQDTDVIISPIVSKVNLSKDNILTTDIYIDGAVKVADPNKLNDNVISDAVYTPSVYIVDPITGDLEHKQRIFSSFDGPWLTVRDSLSTNKNVLVGDIVFDRGVTIDNITVNSTTTTLLGTKFNRKLPIYIEDQYGLISTYYLLASANLS